MKKIKILIFLATSSISAWSQTNTFPASGNVTINSGHLIQSGTYNLQTQGAVKLKDYLLFDSDGDFTGGNYFTIQDDATGDFLRFGRGFNNNLVIKSNGNVGIGTTSPGGSLQIGNYNSNESITIATTQNGTGTLYFKDYNSTEGGGIKVTGISGGSKMEFFNRWDTDQTKVMFDLYSGDVGIGTISPGNKLEVNGNVNIGSNLSSTATQNSTYGNLLYFLGANVNSDPLWMARYNVSGSPNASELRVNIGDDPTHYGDKFVVGVTQGSTWNPRLIVQGDGKVGIGTTDFTGNHKLRVEGSIGAREIKVEASGWSDFVFEDNYTLRPLEEVETYIAENKHLPEIPSEAEVTENGINLGEMNAKLLQKIEELTLYMIEQNKQNQAQQAKIEQLEKEIFGLKSK